MPYPVIRRDRCDPAKPWIVCDLRRDAELNGEMYWDNELRGYVYTDIPPRRVSFRARYYGNERTGLHDGEPYVLERCPFCSVSLPDLQSIADATCDGGGGAE